MKYSGVFHMGVHKATMAAGGCGSGETVDVQIEIDDEPLPTDTVLRDLERAINASKDARAGWAMLPPSHRREHVKHVIEAKKPETRARRIAITVAALVERAARTPLRPPKSAARAARPAQQAKRRKPR
jgi:hypothetical protein